MHLPLKWLVIHQMRYNLWIYQLKFSLTHFLQDTTDNETSTHQVVLQADIHSQPVAFNENRSSSPEKRRGRVRRLLAEQQQQQLSPAIQPAPQVSVFKI